MKLLLENWRQFLTEQQGKMLSIFDFDDTIAASKSRTMARDQKTGEVIQVPDQATQAAMVARGGYDFDFSEFDLVVDPEEITPIVNKMRQRLKEPSTQVMVLTARAPTAEDDIQNYLNTLEPPIDTENVVIFGTEGGNKGQFLLGYLGRNPGFTDIEFHDDSMKNVKDMKKARDFLGNNIRSFKIYHVDDGSPSLVETKG